MYNNGIIERIVQRTYLRNDGEDEEEYHHEIGKGVALRLGLFDGELSG